MAIRIDDLIDPQLSPEQEARLAWADEHPVSLAEADIVEEALTTTGLDDFGSDDFWPRVRGQLEAIEADSDQRQFSLRMQQRRMVRLLSNRLLLTDFLNRY